MGRRRGLLAEMRRQSAIQARERQRAQAAYVRQQAAALREAERARKAAERAANQVARADARAAAEAEKARKQAYLEARLAEVDARNASLHAGLEELDQLLSETLTRDDYVDLQKLKQLVEHPLFDAGQDGRPLPAPPPPRYPLEPAWPQFEPAQPSGLAKAFGKNKHERAIQEAQEQFRGAQETWHQHCRHLQAQHSQAVQEHRRGEQQRLQRLEQAQYRYRQECQERQDAVERQNYEIDVFADAFARRDPDAVVDYFGMVLSRSVYPEGFPQSHRIAYVPESAQLVVEYGLPTIDVVPTAKEYRYVRARDEITTTNRPVKDVRTQYASVVAQVSLRTVHEVFEADRDSLIETVVFNGVVSTTDPATGQPVTPCIVTLRTTREVFLSLDLSAVDPMACLTHLNASVSKRPEELAPVRPVLEFDMVDKRFIEESDVLSGLDQRPNLLELTPNEFESLIQNLFSRMGLDTKQTRASRDGGVDCVAFDHRPIFGGKVIIQAKRYRHTVDVSAVRDLFGTLQNEGASKGILVTTSGYGQASYQFAAGKPLELLDGANLLALLAEHAGVEAKIVDPDKLR
ncbi:restriction endonuclease [Pseudonocardia sp. WMMC193]|uniref:restriction endonuclease n=1 Tax=Pseudonocardia sp. WMMC193 TaxID=2911965 RepID=UPI001F000305|nr:restriction endonuclease [Pseudonocardia sp. WMMC193]MCF7550701.1 restriction endonuclease [Pseudonocardia sp. WMMC193]